MGNKAHTPVIEPKHARAMLTKNSIETLRGHFSLGGAIASSNEPYSLELSKQKFLGHMASFLEAGLWPNTLLERLFSVSDLTQSNTCLRFDDYVALLYILGPTGTKEQKIQLIFRLYDWDACGYVTKKSMSKMLHLSTGMDCIKASSSWKVAVNNYDPRSGTVVESREKLTKGDLSSISEAMIDTAMTFYDTDEDGKLNLQEFIHFASDSLEIDMLLESLTSPTRVDAPWRSLCCRDGFLNI
jgi:Ca2+-binding EF-hand superfamily protein